MKTIIKVEIDEDFPASSYIRRVKDVEAVSYVKEGEWKYAPKSLWKEKIRDIKKKETVPKNKKKGSKKNE